MNNLKYIDAYVDIIIVNRRILGESFLGVTVGSESQVRLSIFIVLFVALAALEFLWPRKAKFFSRKQRWPVNILAATIYTVISQLTIASVPIMASLYVTQNGIGALSFFHISIFYKAVISYVLLDLVIYFQHRIFHEVPFLFKLHMAHHTDRDLDVSSGFRFHFLEILLSIIIKTAFIFLIGANPMGVLIFEVMLSSGALFSHSNINLKGPADRIIRFFIVTPDMHRIHHSVRPEEYNSNFGFTISLWDYLFGSYKSEPKDGQKNMKLGMNKFDDNIGLWEFLKVPFKR